MIISKAKFIKSQATGVQLWIVLVAIRCMFAGLLAYLAPSADAAQTALRRFDENVSEAIDEKWILDEED